MTAQRRPSEMTARERYELSRKERGITRSAERNAKRQELTKLLHGYGFTNKEIHDKNMRDWKRERLEAAITERQRTISKKPTSRRTETEQRNVEAIRAHRAQVKRGDTAAAWAPFDTERGRWDNFSRWSGHSFPSEAQNYIARMNQRDGRPDDDSFGYRVFYHRYVLRKGESDAIAYVDNNAS